MSDLYLDIPTGAVQPQEIGPVQPPVFPFKMNGDRSAIIQRRSYVQLAANYIPATIGFEKDYQWKDAYLCAESDPSPMVNPVAVRFSREYRRIPANQVTYPGSRYIGKPDYTPTTAFNPYDPTFGLAVSIGYATNQPSGASLGAASYSVSTSSLYTATDQHVYTPIKAQTVQTTGFASAGTFTLTYGANTTGALAYTASAGSVATAINGLASIIAAGITVTVPVQALSNSSAGGIDISMTGGTAVQRAVPITMDATGLTVNTSKNPVTIQYTASYQQIKLPTHLTITAHGLSTALVLAVGYPSGSSVQVYQVGSWGSIDANTIWVPNYGNTLYSAQYIGTYASTYSAPATSTYIGGVRLTRTRVTEKFYLPGVTAGITTPSDIPVTAGLQNTNTFLQALLTGLTSWQTYSSEGPARWDNTPIYRTVTTEVNFDDLV